jgi:hypothetical protein
MRHSAHTTPVGSSIASFEIGSSSFLPSSSEFTPHASSASSPHSWSCCTPRASSKFSSNRGRDCCISEWANRPRASSACAVRDPWRQTLPPAFEPSTVVQPGIQSRKLRLFRSFSFVGVGIIFHLAGRIKNHRGALLGCERGP